MDATSKRGVFGRKNFDLILAAVIIIVVFAFIGRSWLGSSGRSGQAPAKAAISKAALEGFKYQTTEGLRYYYQTKEYDKAEQAFRKAIEYSPDDALGYNNLGSALNDQKKWDEAIIVLRRAVELNPDLAIARNNLAWAQSHKAQETNGGK